MQSDLIKCNAHNIFIYLPVASAYKPGSTFRCLDQSKEVPFEYVNDDYCDCPDGSDEPGENKNTVIAQLIHPDFLMFCFLTFSVYFFHEVLNSHCLYYVRLNFP